MLRRTCRCSTAGSAADGQPLALARHRAPTGFTFSNCRSACYRSRHAAAHANGQPDRADPTDTSPDRLPAMHWSATRERPRARVGLVLCYTPPGAARWLRGRGTDPAARSHRPAPSPGQPVVHRCLRMSARAQDRVVRACTHLACVRAVGVAEAAAEGPNGKGGRRGGTNLRRRSSGPFERPVGRCASAARRRVRHEVTHLRLAGPGRCPPLRDGPVRIGGQRVKSFACTCVRVRVRVRALERACMRMRIARARAHAFCRQQDDTVAAGLGSEDCTSVSDDTLSTLAIKSSRKKNGRSCRSSTTAESPFSRLRTSTCTAPSPCGCAGAGGAGAVGGCSAVLRDTSVVLPHPQGQTGGRHLGGACSSSPPSSLNCVRMMHSSVVVTTDEMSDCRRCTVQSASCCARHNTSLNAAAPACRAA